MIGQTLNSRYRVTAQLGKGAMGIVYRATDKQTRQEVALKVVARELALDEEMLVRFRHEGEALRQLRHRNIVAFGEMFVHHGQQVIVMEYVPGGSLHDLLRQGPLPAAYAREIALDLCDALISAHRLNIIHRDIKPENVLLTADGTPKLTDFGMARLLRASTHLTGTGTQVGTPYYMSPEAWEGKPLDAQADVWSLGVMLYEMLTGQVPFGGDSVPAVMTKVLLTSPPNILALNVETPPALAKIVERALARDKTQRYSTVRMMSVDLEQCVLPAAAAEDVLARVRLSQTKTKEGASLLAASAAGTKPKGATRLPGQPVAVSDGDNRVTQVKPRSLPEATGPKVRPRRALIVAGVVGVVCLLIAASIGLWALGGNALIIAWTRPTATPSATSIPTLSPTTQLVEVQVTASPSPTHTPPPPTFTSPPPPTLTFTPTSTPPPPTISATPALPTGTPTLGIGSSMISSKDGMIEVYVPAGEFIMGSTEEQTDSIEEHPQHTVYLDAFWIDQTEVTNTMFAQFVAATKYRTDAEKNKWGMVFTEMKQPWTMMNGADWQHPLGPKSKIDGLDNHPVVQVSWTDANAYCQWAERHLPTEAQWEKAARGTDGRKYPWGDDAVAADRLNFNLLAGAGTAPVGSYPRGASPYGALDMAGNVTEWVADWYGETYYAKSPDRNPTGPGNGEYRILRGGAWNDLVWFVRTASRVKLAPNGRFSGYGFRCASLP